MDTNTNQPIATTDQTSVSQPNQDIKPDININKDVDSGTIKPEPGSFDEFMLEYKKEEQPEVEPKEIKEDIKPEPPKEQEGTKTESITQEPTYREEKLIVNDFAKVQEFETKDYHNLYKEYILRANNPVVIIKDAQGNDKQIYDYKPVVNALKEGIDTGDFSKFIQFLNPQEAYTFDKDLLKVYQYYEEKKKPLYEEFGKHKKGQTVSEWDKFIVENSRDEQEKFLLNKFKEKYDFNADTYKELLTNFREARTVELNKKIIKEETEKLKKEMMGSAVNNTNNINEQKTSYSDTDLRKMSKEQFAELDRKGLITG